MFRRLIRFLTGEPKSKNVAKNRLKLIIVQDRLGVDEDVMRELQIEITNLLSKYFTLDHGDVEIDLQREDNSMALMANIPITGMKRHEN